MIMNIFRNIKRRIPLFLATGFTLLFSLSYVLPADTGNAGSATYEVKTVSMKNSILFTGEVKAKRSIEIVSPRGRERFGGSISYLPTEGATVKKGDRLVEFDTSDLLSEQLERQRNWDEAKISLEMTKANLRAEQADQESAVESKKTAVEVAKLYAAISKDLLPANTYKRYQLNLEEAKLALQQVEEQMANFLKNKDLQIKIAELAVETAKIDLDRLQNDIDAMAIKAPQDGLVIYGDNWMNNRKVQIGDTIFGGQTVVSLPDLSEMQVICDVYDMEMKQIKPGQSAIATMDSLPGKVWNGVIESITSIAVRKSFASKAKVFKATVSFPSADTTQMKPGMTARIEVPISVRESVLAVPREYLFVDQQGVCSVHKVTDVKKGTTTVVPVKIGEVGSRMVEVVEGLTAGEMISSN